MTRNSLCRFLVSIALVGSAAGTIPAQSSSDTAPPRKAGDSAKQAPAKSTRDSARRKSTGDTSKGTSNAPAPRGLSPEARRDSIIDAMWPVKGPDPLPGSILPHTRVIAFYGNLLSTRMGVLGEYEPDEMLRRLDAEVAAWTAADPTTPAARTPAPRSGPPARR